MFKSKVVWKIRTMKHPRILDIQAPSRLPNLTCNDSLM